MSVRRHLPDEAARRRAVEERNRNLILEAGAGTGKTSLLVERLVALVAPGDDGPALEIGAIAAITRSPSAAGELRLGVRERLLAELGAPGSSERRAARLRAALAGLEAAPLGTAHDLADRLLCRRPMEAGLSPAFEVMDDPAELAALARETARLLVEAAQAGTLAAELGLGGAGTRARAPALPGEEAAVELPLALAAEAEQTVQDALRLGLRAETEEHEHAPRLGLDALVQGFVLRRDARPRVTRVVFDRERFRRAVDELTALARGVTGRSAGAGWIRGSACLAAAVRDEVDPLAVLRALGPALTALRDPTLRRAFEGDQHAWAAWKALSEGRGRPGGAPLLRDLLDPAEEQLAIRLARIEPVALALHERVKRRRRAVDLVDLLSRLRDLLAQSRAARAELQALFRHIVVDDAQDLHPLQAEILLYLAEDGAVAQSARAVRLAPGRLTLAGDPRQAIFRARGADVAAYEELRERLLEAGALEVTLAVSVRQRPALLGWMNDRAAELFAGPSPTPGEARGQPLQPAAPLPDPNGPAVHVIPLEIEGDPARPPAMAWRALEARALAAYLRWLVEDSGVTVRGARGERRPVRHGDVAVLALEATHLDLLVAELDRQGVPHAARAGRLFLEDPLHRRFLLGLRALADPDDGVALATLLRPPFFAVDLEDLWRSRAAARSGAPADEGARRVAAAMARVLDLRARRLARPPFATARDLLEQTAIGRAAALGPSGARRLAGLRALCFALAELAAREGLDYDAATARMRAWVDRPPELPSPAPSPAGAVQLLTAHQARGLEFPVVALWDGRALWAPRERPAAWCVDGHSGAWALCLHGEDRWHLLWGRELLAEEREHQLAERRRLVHAALTRARDLLVIARAGRADEATVAGKLLRGTRPGEALELAPYRDPAGAPWAAPPPAEPPPAALPRVEAAPPESFHEAALAAARPRFQPREVTAPDAEAPASMDPDDPAEPLEPPAPPAGPEAARGGRFGPTFDEAIRRAVILLVSGRAASPQAAVRAAALEVGLNRRLAEAARDVARARAALRAEGLWGQGDVTLLADYPIAGVGEGGALLSGSLDLVAAAGDRIDVMVIRSDPPPADPALMERHLAELRASAPLLEAAGLTAGRRLRWGVLFTGEGVIQWA